ncbi:serine kinase [Salipiger sp. IMCC34102]|uniref:HPr kinase/phosphorylase n=1 Tax=Salipiger sp. IMCC34102 TaxID=2510647 RepID=UPI00101D2CED|nr:HPr kinase/phosphatase C-terminal domain-containing protein [Salipiger sp. IMCC34102]RYH04327.1 serine kinase [Salipiger sp. IMCC34102]
MTDDPLTLQASCIAVDGRGLLLRGPSGAGKSATALHLMALGAVLVADDMVLLSRQGDRVIAGCPPAGRGLIEARGLGLLRATPAPPVPLSHVVDLGPAGARLPPHRQVTILGCDLPLHRCPGGLESAGALMQLMRAGRHA